MQIRDKCKRHGVTMAEFASKMGVSPLTVYRWQGGTRFPRATELVRMAKFFGCTVDDLLKDEGGKDNDAC